MIYKNNAFSLTEGHWGRKRGRLETDGSILGWLSLSRDRDSYRAKGAVEKKKKGREKKGRYSNAG